MKYIKYILGILLALILLIVIYVRLAVHESRPEIQEDQDASVLVNKMKYAINQKAWDTLPYISWSFRDAHHYVWDREANKAIVQWDDYTVHLDPDQVSGKALENGSLVEGDQDKLVKKAWSYWCNDMYWLAAPFKINDPGTSLAVAKDAEGKEGLLVTYNSGGVTPGDAYLWYLTQDGLPTGYKMWVSIIPVGGIYTSWEDWKSLPGGAKIAQAHQGNVDFLKIPITNIKAGDSWQALGYDSSPIDL